MKRLRFDRAVNLIQPTVAIDLSARCVEPSKHVYRVGAPLPARQPADGGDAPAGSVSAAARPEEAGRRTPAAAQRGRVPAGLPQTVPQVLPLEGAAGPDGTPHHHSHLAALDA